MPILFENSPTLRSLQENDVYKRAIQGYEESANILEPKTAAEAVSRIGLDRSKLPSAKNFEYSLKGRNGHINIVFDYGIMLSLKSYSDRISYTLIEKGHSDEMYSDVGLMLKKYTAKAELLKKIDTFLKQSKVA